MNLNPMDIKFMSFNIQHGADFYRRHRIDLHLMAEAIASCEADIIGLNEVRGRGKAAEYTAQAEKMADILGYHCYFAQAVDFGGDVICGNSPYGNAILSKYPIIRAESVAIPDPLIKDEDAYYETRCVLKADFVLGQYGALTVLVTHMGLANSEQHNAVETVTKLLDEIKNPCVLMGDFNMTPDNMTLAPIYLRMNDTAMKFNESKFSFPSHHPEIKIDYIFASQDIEIVTADIPNIIASDHRPHTAVLRIKR